RGSAEGDNALRIPGRDRPRRSRAASECARRSARLDTRSARTGTAEPARGGLVELDLGDDSQLDVDVERAFRATADAERCIAARAWERAEELTSDALDRLRLPFFPTSESAWAR